jgi:hypothetical protein
MKMELDELQEIFNIKLEILKNEKIGLLFKFLIRNSSNFHLSNKKSN